MLRFFPPVVTGTIITIIGVSLMRVGVGWAVGGPAFLAQRTDVPKLAEICLLYTSDAAAERSSVGLGGRRIIKKKKKSMKKENKRNKKQKTKHAHINNKRTTIIQNDKKRMTIADR